MCGRLKRCRTPRQKAPHPHTGTPSHACTQRIHAHTHARARPAGRSPRAPVVPPSATKTSRLAAPAATGGRRQHHSVANISIMFVCGFILLWRVCVYIIYIFHTHTSTHTTLDRHVIRLVYMCGNDEGAVPSRYYVVCVRDVCIIMCVCEWCREWGG